MPLLPQFIGPSSQLEANQAAIQRCVNWILAPNEFAREEPKFTFTALPAPTNAAFGQLPVPAPFNQWSRGLVEIRGRVFGVNGTAVFEIDSTGTYSSIGSVKDDGLPVCMVPTGTGQVFICSAGKGYVIPNGAGVGSLIPVTSGGFLGAGFATFQDGYILTTVPNSNINQISGDDNTPIGDATIWDAANEIVQAGQADNQRAIISSREYVRMLGYRRSQVYQNVGQNGIGGFPFQSYNETFIETGIGAPFSLVDMGDSLIWIGEDSRGQRACWRDAAFQPQRVSDFGVERWWQNYTSVEDAMAFSFIWMGHLIYQITFPSARVSGGQKLSATWLYDATASALSGKPIWTERSYLSGGGLQDAADIAPGRAEVTHCYAFGKHLVGSNGTDGNPGAIYQYSDTFLDCGADPISGTQITQPQVCDRITPHLWPGEKRMTHNRIEFEIQRGVGNQIDPGKDPQLLLRWSNDGGMTFGTEYSLPMGKAGQYTIRVALNRLGYSQHPGRVYWVRCADPCLNALMNVSSDFYAQGS